MLSLINNCRSGPVRALKAASCGSIQHYFLSPTLSRLMSADPCGTRGKRRKRPPRGTSGPTQNKSPIKVTYKPYVPKCYTDHDAKNMSLNRPMSPHLTIFAMTTPATMSIVQRVTGTIVTVYALLLAGGTLFLSNGVETYVSIIQSLNLGAMTVMIIKIVLGMPFVYHYFNGIRFCMWNAGRWLDMKEVSSTAKSCIIATIAATAFFALL